MSDAKENENMVAEQALPGSSDTNEGNHPVNPLQENPSLTSPGPLEADSIRSNTKNTNFDNNVELHSTPPQISPSSAPNHNEHGLLKPASESSATVDLRKPTATKSDSPSSSNPTLTAETTNEVITKTLVLPPNPAASAKSGTSSALPQSETNFDVVPMPTSTNEKGDDSKSEVNKLDLPTPPVNGNSNSEQSFVVDDIHFSDGNESGTEEEQSAFLKQLEIFFKERSMEFKPPKFYGEELNCLKLWRYVTRLGGYDKVTSCKLWRQVGEYFNPPKTCTTVSWSFRGFYEKALLDYEKYKTHGGELSIPIACQSEPVNADNQDSGSVRAKRGAAVRARQDWHSRHLRNDEVSDPIIKDKNSISMRKREKQLKSLGLLKRKRPSYLHHAVKAAPTKVPKAHVETTVVDIGPPADWVKINVQKTKDCFEVYALVPGLLREEVRVQSDPTGHLVISGEPEHIDNPWGVTAFKKVVSLPSKIDPHQTSAVVTLHGQLLVRVPLSKSD